MLSKGRWFIVQDLISSSTLLLVLHIYHSLWLSFHKSIIQVTKIVLYETDIRLALYSNGKKVIDWQMFGFQMAVWITRISVAATLLECVNIKIKKVFFKNDLLFYLEKKCEHGERNVIIYRQSPIFSSVTKTSF